MKSKNWQHNDQARNVPIAKIMRPVAINSPAVRHNQLPAEAKQPPLKVPDGFPINDGNWRQAG